MYLHSSRANVNFVVMLLCVILLCGLVRYCAAQELPANISKDDFAIEISFRNYSIINSPGQVLDATVELSGLTTLTINVVDIPPGVTFILLQAHTLVHNLSLSYNKDFSLHSYINGSNVGLVQILAANQKKVQFFLLNTDEFWPAEVLVAAQGYGKDAPIPGGCNMEFPVEIAPFLSVAYNASVVEVEVQAGAAPLGFPPTQRSCEMQHVELEMYHVYMPEGDMTTKTYFRMIKEMMTVYGIQQSGRKVELSLEGSRMRRFFSAYPGTGSVYAVIAISGFSGAAYVPSVSYACQVSLSQGRCGGETTFDSEVYWALLVILGLFICFCGQRHFKYEMFFFSYLAAGFVTFIIISQHGLAPEDALRFAVIVGFAFAVMWLFCWCVWGIPCVSVLLATLMLGCLLASIIMYAGAGDYQIFDNDLNFWIVFGSIMLTVPIIFMGEAHKGNVVCCGVLGAYMVIFAIDYYIGSNLKYILLNTVRRAVVPAYRVAAIDPPFQVPDLMLSCLWLVLATLGISYQLYRDRHLPPFHDNRHPCYHHSPPPMRRRPFGVATDRTPLMTAAHRPYGAAAAAAGASSTGDDSVFLTPSTSERKYTVMPNFPPPSATAPPPKLNKELF